MNAILFEIEALQNCNKDRKTKKKIGQFFTSAATAHFMSGLASPRQASVRILDPGAGAGILGAAVALRLLETANTKEISITFLESDQEVLPLLQQTVEKLKKVCSEHNVLFSANILSENFITAKTEGDYDLVICNPPYLKIRKDSVEALSMIEYVHGQPNLYGLFMCKALELLRDGGQYIFITPRSWTSGTYFRNVRMFLCSNINIERLHIFKSRDKAFSNNSVLQETMILSGTKSLYQAKKINISISTDDSYADKSSFNAPSSIIKPVDATDPLLIPSSASDLLIIEQIQNLPETFDSLGYAFKTGPVVEFRNSELISEAFNSQFTIPMFRAANIQESRFCFPVQNGKAQYISEMASKLLLPNQNTLLVKRLSSKEEKRRLQSCPYYKEVNTSYISIENHVNFLTRKDGAPLKREEIKWAQTILESEQYETFFRVKNGSTQVNANDLNSLPIGGPPL